MALCECSRPSEMSGELIKILLYFCGNIAMGRKEGNVLFNDALNIFYFIYG